MLKKPKEVVHKRQSVKTKMRKQTYQKLVLLLVLAIASLFLVAADTVQAANPNLVNFQGKMVNADGTNVADASYTFRFCLYSTATPATPCTGAADNDAIWRESKSLSTVNGVFQTLLGDVTTLPNFNSNPTLYLGVNFNADAAGELTPRIRLASVPYALNTDLLGGLSSSNFVQLAQGVQTDASTTNPSIFINKTGSTANILQLQKTAGDVLVINNSGLSTFFTDVDLTFAGTENLVITSDLAGTADLISITGTPSGSAGTTKGLTIAQANHASNTNGLDIGLNLNNVDTDLAVTDGIYFDNTGGGGYTDFIDTASGTFKVTGAGVLTAADITCSSASCISTGEITDATITGDDIASSIAGNGLVLTAGTPDVLDIVSGNAGIVANANDITLDATVAGDALSATTSSGSGLEIVAAQGLTLLQGCANNEILKWNETTDVWACAADGGGAGSTTLAQAYTNGAVAADQTLLLTAADGGGLVIEDAATTVGSLFTIKENTANGGSALLDVTALGLTMVDTSNVNGLSFTFSTRELRIFDTTAANFASITATSTSATFKSNTGTTIVGNGSGDITLSTTARGDVVIYTHTGSGGGTTDNDFTITRNITGGVSTLAHNILRIEDLSTTSGTDNPSIIFVNKTNTGFTGNFVDIQLNGIQKFVVTAGGSVAVAAGQSLDTIAAGALTIGTTATSLGVNTNTTVTGETTGAALTVSNSTSTGNILTLNDNATLVASIADGGAANFQNSVNSYNAFKIENSAGLDIANVNTLVSGWNLIPSGSFEQNINGWAAKATPTGPTWDNTASNANFGSATLRFVNDAAGDGVSYAFPFKASTQYSLSFYAKASVSQAFTLGRQDNGSDIDTGCTNGSNSITINTAPYQQFTCTFTTGATINGASNFYIKQSGAGTPTINIDGATLVEASTALAYVPPANNLQIDANWSNLTLNAGQDPEIQPWQLNGNALTTARRGATTITANGFAYFIGGTASNGASGAPTTTINFAKVNSDGSTGAWSTSGITALPVALYGHSSFVYNGYLYVIGGCSADGAFTANCATAVNTVYYSKLNGDGTNSAWQTNANPLPAIRGYGAATITNGFVYYLGGYGSGAAQSTAYSAKLNGDGSISSWTTLGALSAIRYGHTAVGANGNIYMVGGCNDAAGTCGTALTTVEWATPTITGGISSWTATTALGTATGLHTSAVLNGYIYNFGGRQAGAPVTAVTYSKISGANSLGIWTTSAFPLPVARQGAATIWANNYAYVFGGFDGTATLPTSGLYTGGARVMVFGALDLVGLTGQGLGDYGGGGTLTAGNTRIVGDLRVEGWADFNNGLSVDSNLNINAVSATNGQTVLNINNSSSNSIFSVQHMAANFGSLVRAGAFEAKNSYFGEEFNVQKQATCSPTAASGSAINSWARGDLGVIVTTPAACSATANATVGRGELSFATSTGGTTTFASCTATSPSVTTANGVERITATSVATAGASANCVENLTGTATASNKIYAAANLPVIQMKVRPQTLVASNNNARVQVGLLPADSASGLGNNSPANSIYFTNCSTWVNGGTPTGCSNTTWYGVSSGATTAVVVTCSGTMSATQFAYLRIEVRSTTDIRFYADVDTSNGVTETECGSGVTATATASALTPWMQAMFLTNTANSTILDIDYFRGWQDDNIPLPPEAVTETPSGEEIVTEAPLSIDTPSEDPNSFFSLNAALSEDTTFENDVYIKGTLFADKIKANSIEGLEILTDKIASLGAAVDNQNSADEQNTSLQALDLTNFQVQNLNVLLALNVGGGLKVGGLAQFNGESIFDKLVTFSGQTLFRGDASFEGRTTFNSDTGGFALIEKDEKQVDVKFDKPYDNPPIITISIRNGQFVSYVYKELVNDKTKKIEGFTILLKNPADEDTEFAWTAFQIKDPRTAKAQTPTTTD